MILQKLGASQLPSLASVGREQGRKQEGITLHDRFLWTQQESQPPLLSFLLLLPLNIPSVISPCLQQSETFRSLLLFFPARQFGVWSVVQHIPLCSKWQVNNIFQVGCDSTIHRNRFSKAPKHFALLSWEDQHPTV